MAFTVGRVPPTNSASVDWVNGMDTDDAPGPTAYTSHKWSNWR